MLLCLKGQEETLVLYWTSYCACCGDGWSDYTGLFPLFVEPSCAKSQHCWNCFGRVELLGFFSPHCDV